MKDIPPPGQPSSRCTTSENEKAF